MALEATRLGNPEGELYAKVISSVPAKADARSEVRVRFTSVSPEIKNWLRTFGTFSTESNPL
jgi:hypothetical protein